MEIDTRTPDEILADLERRQKDHVFMTSVEAEEWNAQREKSPLSKNHWSVKAARIKHVIRMGSSWKRLAKRLRAQLVSANFHIELVTDRCKELSRRMIPCDRCDAQAGSACTFHCPRDGRREEL